MRAASGWEDRVCDAGGGGRGPLAVAATRADPASFAPGPGRAFAEKACSSCHVAAQVTSQRKSRVEWVATVEKTIGFGAQVPDDKFEALVTSLATNYPADR